MLWTLAQKERIIVSYGHEGEAYCPNDGTLLVMLAGFGRGLTGGAVNLSCPCCGEQLGQVWRPSTIQPMVRYLAP